MRKGVVKLIEKVNKNGFSNNTFIKWLEESDYDLKRLSCATGYYCECMRNGQDASLIFSEIRKYIDLNGYSLMLEYQWEKGDILLNKDDIKAKILEAYNCFDKRGYAYDKLYRNIFPLYKDDTELQSILLELADKWNEYIICGKALHCGDFGWEAWEYCDVANSYETALEYHKERYYSDIDIKMLLWDDFVNNKRNSVLYRAWNDGREVFVKHCPIKEFQHDFGRGFGQQFVDYIKSLPGNLSDNLALYFMEVDGFCKLYVDEGPIKLYVFDYNTALEDVEEGNVCHSVVSVMQKQSPDIQISKKYTIYEYNEDLISKMQEASGGIDFSVASPFYKFEFKFSWSGCLNIYLTRYDKTKSKKNDDGELKAYGEGVPASFEFFMNRDNQIFYRHIRNSNKGEKSSWYPLTMKKLIPFIKCHVLQEFFEALANTTKNYLLKDVLKDMQECGDNFICPITYADTIKYHNKADYFFGSYKAAGVLRWNYNKHNMNLSYMIIKSLNKVDINDYGILQNTPDDMLRFIHRPFRSRKINTAIAEFLAGYYVKKDERLKNEAYDFVNMCINDNQPVVLRYSIARMLDEHNHFMDNKNYAYYRKNVAAFRIPKNSKYRPLRKILPDDFEWIKTKKRLIDETMEMHHCVWSYYDKIARDGCAIYSYYDETGEFDTSNEHKPKRYTIEFNYSNKTNTYSIKQVQTKYDRFGGEKLARHIKQLLA
jgi:hypothetical protein